MPEAMLPSCRPCRAVVACFTAACRLQPLLDVLLFTRSLSNVMGYKGQIALYLYYIGVAFMLKAIAPPLAAMTAQESALVGAFRWAAWLKVLGGCVTNILSMVVWWCWAPIDRRCCDRACWQAAGRLTFSFFPQHDNT
jgi:hypothetical protein